MKCQYCQKKFIPSEGIGPSRPIEYAPYVSADEVADSKNHEARVAEIALNTNKLVKQLQLKLYHLYSEELRLFGIYKTIPERIRESFKHPEIFLPLDTINSETNVKKNIEVSVLETCKAKLHPHI